MGHLYRTARKALVIFASGSRIATFEALFVCSANQCPRDIHDGLPSAILPPQSSTVFQND